MEIPVGATKVLDEEAKKAQEQREKISRVTETFEAIVLAEDLTMGDLLEVFGLFTSRANRVFEDIKIKQIKDSYGKI